MPDPLRLNTVIPTRKLEHDLARLKNTNVAAAPGSAFETAAPNASQGLPPERGSVQDSRTPAIGGGNRASAIVAKAQELKRTRVDERNYWPVPDESCASFVSTVLIEVGIFPKKTPAVSQLVVVMEQTGAVNVVPRDTPITPSNVARLVPGDIVVYHDAGKRFGHSSIYVGNNQVIAAGSSSGVVEQYPPRSAGYRFMAAWRYAQ